MCGGGGGGEGGCVYVCVGGGGGGGCVDVCVCMWVVKIFLSLSVPVTCDCVQVWLENRCVVPLLMLLGS